jgi:hypothetical protein
MEGRQVVAAERRSDKRIDCDRSIPIGGSCIPIAAVSITNEHLFESFRDFKQQYPDANAIGLG